MIMRVPKFAVLAAVALSLATACGSGAAPGTTTPTGGTTATAVPTGGPSTTLAPTAAPLATTSAATTSPTLAATPAPVQTAGSIDLCSLLTAAEIGAIIGGSWIEGVLTSTGGYCHWDNARGGLDQVITAIENRTVDAIKTAAPGGKAITVSGHAAYTFRDEGSQVQTTFIDIGGRSLLVEFSTSSDPTVDGLNAAKLADTVISHM
jgi:hypothetical protein